MLRGYVISTLMQRCQVMNYFIFDLFTDLIIVISDYTDFLNRDWIGIGDHSNYSNIHLTIDTFLRSSNAIFSNEF